MASLAVKIVVQTLILGANWVQKEVSLLKGVTTELQNMTTKMQFIQTVLEDAENQSVKKPTVKLWLQKLQDVSYDMVDILDEWYTRFLMQKRDEAESSSSQTSKFTFNIFSSAKDVAWRRDIALRIKDINKKMNLVFKEMEEFKFVSKAVGNDGLSKIINHNDLSRTTTSFVDESKVFERDSDKNFLLNKVLSVNTDQHKSPQVISIIGVGGLGKTTLAQLVYNDEKVKEKFDKHRVWVCVSNPFDEVKVAQDIIEGLQVGHTKTKSLQTLHQYIEKTLSNKKFLVVLDDVWDEDFSKWEHLSICLKAGDPDSIILVTTRKEEVARTMGTSLSNILKPQLISDLNCWLIISQRAFQTRSNKDSDELEMIGKNIANKCKGLPLAAKALGGLLMSKESIDEWREVLNSEIWKLEKIEMELFPHIFLSYQELPLELKRCFLILALFPKDSELDVELVIHLWMAHGLLNTETPEDDMVKTGKKYLKFLVSRAFLEERHAEHTTVSMHNIMHDFAQHLSGDELLSIIVLENIENGSNSKSTSKGISFPTPTKALHLMTSGNINPSPIDAYVGKLRTCYLSNVLPDVTSDLVKGLKMVRALYLGHCHLKQVPQSIVNLIHLRVLFLSNNPLVELPTKIGDLYNLQQLSLDGVDGLSSLPDSMGKLINLISLTPGELLLEKAPESAGKLINLQNLGRVRVKAGENNLGLLKDLNQLRGVLQLEFSSDYGNEVDANEASIGRKAHIIGLDLFFNNYKITDGVVAALQPPPNIQTLRIYGLLPSWLTSLNYLSELEVHGGENVSILPPLGELQSLKKLLISKVPALGIIHREFLGMDYNLKKNFCGFPKLVELKFIDCHELTRWEDLHAEVEDANCAINVMPNLEILQFEGCNKFEELPRRLLRKTSSLKKLLIEKKGALFDFDVKDIVEGVAGRLCLRQGFQRLEMSVKSSKKVPDSTIYHNYITLLDLYCVQSISYLPPMGKLPYLESLTIRDFSSLKFIGREFLGVNNNEAFVAFPNLVKLEISECELLEGWEDLKPEDEGTLTVMPKLEVLQIRYCIKFEVVPYRLLLLLGSSLKVLYLPDGAPPVSLQGEELENRKVLPCRLLLNLLSCLKVSDLPSLRLQGEERVNGVFASLPQPPGLEVLSIVRYKATELPNWIIDLNNLTKLEVKGAENVSSLPALGNLPSLDFLSIESLSVLKSIGREFLGIENTTNKGAVAFPKLDKLYIENCSELKEWEDIKPEEEDQITIMPNLRHLSIMQCIQLDILPHRLLCKAASLNELHCNYNNDSLAENIKHDKRLLGHVKKVYVNNAECSLHPSTSGSVNDKNSNEAVECTEGNERRFGKSPVKEVARVEVGHDGADNNLSLELYNMKVTEGNTGEDFHDFEDDQKSSEATSTDARLPGFNAGLRQCVICWRTDHNEDVCPLVFPVICWQTDHNEDVCPLVFPDVGRHSKA